jgi:hypothetical protein
MSRLTITLSEPRYRALKKAAAQRDKIMGQLIDESLYFFGIKSREQALELVRRAARAPSLSSPPMSWWLVSSRPRRTKLQLNI